MSGILQVRFWRTGAIDQKPHGRVNFDRARDHPRSAASLAMSLSRLEPGNVGSRRMCRLMSKALEQHGVERAGRHPYVGGAVRGELQACQVLRSRRSRGAERSTAVKLGRRRKWRGLPPGAPPIGRNGRVTQSPSRRAAARRIRTHQARRHSTAAAQRPCTIARTDPAARRGRKAAPPSAPSRLHGGRAQLVAVGGGDGAGEGGPYGAATATARPGDEANGIGARIVAASCAARAAPALTRPA